MIGLIRRSPRIAEILFIFSVWLLEVVGGSNATTDFGASALTAGLAAGSGTLLLVLRHRCPSLTLIAEVGHYLACAALLADYRPVIVVPVALYAFATTRGTRPALIGLIGTYLVTAPIVVLDELSRPLAQEDTVVGVTRASLLAQGVALLAAWGVGRWARSTREAAQVREELAVVERRDAVREERLRIAREMHDVVSHAVTTMTVQAAAARHLLPVDPARAADALERVEDGGSAAVDELRTMLGVLRNDDKSPPGGVGVGLDEIDSLVEGARRAGLWVRVELDSTAEPSPEVALVVVRAVQEALTNVVKYAGRGADVTINLWRTTTGLRLIVRDDGGIGLSIPQPRTSGGFGLTGLAERAAAVGGTLAAAPIDRGGFEVVLDLPRKMLGGAAAMASGSTDRHIGSDSGLSTSICSSVSGASSTAQTIQPFAQSPTKSTAAGPRDDN